MNGVFLFLTTFWEARDPDVVVPDLEPFDGWDVFEENPGQDLVEGVQSNEAGGEGRSLVDESLVRGIFSQLVHLKI